MVGFDCGGVWSVGLEGFERCASVASLVGLVAVEFARCSVELVWEFGLSGRVLSVVCVAWCRIFVSGLYNWDDDRLDRLDRVVLVVFGLLSLLVALLSLTFSIPTVFFGSSLASPVVLLCLSVIPTTVLSIQFGIRAEETD